MSNTTAKPYIQNMNQIVVNDIVLICIIMKYYESRYKKYIPNNYFSNWIQIVR